MTQYRVVSVWSEDSGHPVIEETGLYQRLTAETEARRLRLEAGCLAADVWPKRPAGFKSEYQGRGL